MNSKQVAKRHDRQTLRWRMRERAEAEIFRLPEQMLGGHEAPAACVGVSAF